MNYEGPLFVHTAHTDAGKAALTVDLTKASAHRVQPFLYGKFCEHLGQNIYHGMDAQILRNPTFGKWQFGAGENLIDGGAIAEIDLNKIEKYADRWTRSLGLPESAQLFQAYTDSLAFFWTRLGTNDEVRTSADVGPHRGRAQRIEIYPGPSAERGIAQWTALPTHRTRKFQYRIVARSQRPVTLDLSLSCSADGGRTLTPLEQHSLELSSDWQTLRGALEIKPEQKLPEGSNFRVALTTQAPANIVLGRVLLYPDDHMQGFDPDVIARLKAAKLPLLRWPGGNFVSGYRWRDGVGPVDSRPTLPNPAWDGLEYNFMGTDEFMTYCKLVGCEPFVCVNGGDGTPEEAAAWVEYCNGSVNTPMGRLRAENGHPEPYNIRHWEVGNEISGPWQVSWTYSGGYADRYMRMTAAMLKVDPTISLQACGVVGEMTGEWTDRLIADCAPRLRSITYHILNGAPVTSQTDPAELYHAFMGQAEELGRSFAEVRRRMLNAGIKQPRVSVTECQLFPRFRGEPKPDGKLTPQTNILPDTISEALYLTTLVNACIRMGDFVEMFTHSATVNHGGGLSKSKERVFAHPVQYAHEMSVPLMNGTPVAVELTSGAYGTNTEFAQIPKLKSVPNLDALAVVTEQQDALVLLLVHRHATSGPVQLSISLKNFSAAATAEVVTLADEVAHGRNTPAQPDRIRPRTSSVKLQDGQVALTLAPYSLTRVTVRKR